MDLLRQFNEFADTHGLLPANGRFLATVSGGVDSVVLAHLLGQRKQPFGIAHCNFCLRGQESDEDELFVRNLAAKLEVPVFVQRFETKKHATENGLSIQMAARDLRYRWFESVRKEYSYSHVATGHNLNDSVETALLNLVRGTGLSGLGGMPNRNGTVVRPLLFATRQNILDFATANEIAWREDSSNNDEHYTRNTIRHRVLPHMEKLNPSFLHGASETLRRMRAADANLQYFLGSLLEKKGATDGYYLDKHKLETLPFLADALFDLLQPFGFTSDQAQQIAGCRNQTGMEWHAPSGYRIVADRESFLLTNTKVQADSILVHADDLLVRLPDGSHLVLLPTENGEKLPNDVSTALVDAAVLQFPLLLRHWKPGDVFQPLGLDGKSQKLQDFFTNRKLSRLEKERAWVLEDFEGRIIWIVGMRLDDRFKVNAESFNLLKLNWIKH